MFRVLLLLTVLQLTVFVSCRNLKSNAEPLRGEVSDEEIAVEGVKDTTTVGSECLIGKKTFVVNATEKMTWFAGYLYCRDKNMTLPIIANAEEHQQLVNTIKEQKGNKDVGVWTSGYYDTDEKKYKWMTRLTPMNYTVWRPGRPDTSGDHKCVELKEAHQYKMNDICCLTENYVACQTVEKSWGKCESQ